MLKKRPTAIFANDDDMAAAVLAALQRLNLKILQHFFEQRLDRELVAHEATAPPGA